MNALNWSKNGHDFNIVCEDAELYNCIINPAFEPDTFSIISKFSKKDKYYLDIGAWIGIMSLYASKYYKRVYAIEADSVALRQLKSNIGLNNAKNIFISEKAISDNNGIADFGGNGDFGNSMTTLLVNDAIYLEEGGHKEFLPKEARNTPSVKVKTTTIETILKEHKIDRKKIGLIKMDIEGGEKIVIPAMKTFLSKNKIPLHISLHWIYLKKYDMGKIINLLFDIYPFCYNENLSRIISRQELMAEEISGVLFTNKKIK